MGTHFGEGKNGEERNEGKGMIERRAKWVPTLGKERGGKEGNEFRRHTPHGCRGFLGNLVFKMHHV